jgi:hypothetical protein
MKLQFSRPIFQEYSNTKFHDEGDSRFSQFCERAQKKLDTANMFEWKPKPKYNLATTVTF